MPSPFRSPSDSYDPRGLAVGPLLNKLLEKEYGLKLQQWRWLYGSAWRENPYLPHVQISGRFMTSMGELDGFYPGDHKGCLCTVEPVYRRANRVLGRLAVRQAVDP